MYRIHNNLVYTAIVLSAVFLLSGCSPIDQALAAARTDADTPSELQKQVEKPVVDEPNPLDILDAELKSIENELRGMTEEIESAPEEEAAVDPAPGPIVEDAAAKEPDQEIDPDREAVAQWLMDPSILDDPDAKYFLVVAREIAAIRSDMERLRQTMDAHHKGFVGDLQQENAQLRRELRRAYALRGDAGDLPMLPIQDSPFAEADRMWAESAPQGIEWTPPPGEMAQPIASGAGSALTENDGANVTAIVGSTDAQYAIIAEWGRTPEAASARGDDTTSMFGMIAVVSPQTSEEEVIALGHELREEYANYDNVNVSIFTDTQAAETYSKSNSLKDGVPLLRISKFRKTGEDAVYLNKDGADIDVTAR